MNELPDASRILNEGLELFAQILYSHAVDIIRPDYTSATSTATSIAVGIKCRADVEKGDAEPNLSGAEYYVNYLSRKFALKPGDVLVPSAMYAGGSVPITTVQNLSRTKDLVTFRSNRQCKIVKKKGADPLYDNVYFDFISTTSPGEAIDSEMEGSLPLLTHKAVIFNRSGLVPGLYLYDNNDPTGIFSIFHVEGTGAARILHLERGAR